MENVSSYLLLKRRSITLAAADRLIERTKWAICENRNARMRREADLVPDYGREF